MERRKSEPLDFVLQRFMRSSGLETPLNQYRLIQSWAKVAGTSVQEKTTELYIRNQTLYVRLSSSSLRANLMMGRSRLTTLLNREVKATVITDIVFL